MSAFCCFCFRLWASPLAEGDMRNTEDFEFPFQFLGLGFLWSTLDAQMLPALLKVFSRKLKPSAPKALDQTPKNVKPLKPSIPGTLNRMSTCTEWRIGACILRRPCLRKAWYDLLRV